MNSRIRIISRKGSKQPYSIYERAIKPPKVSEEIMDYEIWENLWETFVKAKTVLEQAEAEYALIKFDLERGQDPLPCLTKVV